MDAWTDIWMVGVDKCRSVCRKPNLLYWSRGLLDSALLEKKDLAMIYDENNEVLIVTIDM